MKHLTGKVVKPFAWKLTLAQWQELMISKEIWSKKKTPFFTGDAQIADETFSVQEASWSKTKTTASASAGSGQKVQPK
jgi:hypothetical protein